MNAYHRLKAIVILVFILTSCSASNTENNSSESSPSVSTNDSLEQEDLPHQRINFKVNGEPFVMNSSFVANERELRDDSGRKVMRFYLVQDNYEQSLDILFPLLTSQTKAPITWEFKNRNEADPNNIDYAICLWSSKDMPGWHEVPYKNSYITITEWNPQTKMCSGNFQLFIQNDEQKKDTIKITEGSFENIPFDGSNSGPSIGVNQF